MDAGQNTDQNLLDVTIFLASQASERQVIDPLLDTVRSVTAQMRPGQPLTSADRAKLLKVQEQIKDYLINRDPLKVFTKESIERKLAERTSEDLPLLQRRPIIGLAGVWVLSFLLYFLTFLIPFPLSLNDRAQLSSPMFFVGLHAGTAWFYLSGLKNIKAHLRQAYYAIVAGVLIIVVGVAHLPIVQLFGLTNLPVFRYGGFLASFTVASIFLYLGPVLFAKLLGLKTRFANPWLCLGLSALAAAFSIIGGQMLGRADVFFFDLAIAACLINAILCGLGAVICWKIVRTVTQLYSRALTWFGAALAMVALGSINSAVVIWLTPNMHSLGPPYSMIPYMISELLMLQSGYVFKKRAGA
jgi:hypothetical protein